MKEEIFLGNGAVALGLMESGCQVVTSYPGTPSSEILPEVIRLKKSEKLNTYVEWSTNEKVALDNAFAAAISGKRAACCMKQVGLNVAADTLMSAVYMGTIGGLVIVSCDDPGPHSSQTEQDTRLMARLAKCPFSIRQHPAKPGKWPSWPWNCRKNFVSHSFSGRLSVSVTQDRTFLGETWKALPEWPPLKKTPADGRPPLAFASFFMGN